MPKFINIANQRYGRLIVLCQVEHNKWGQIQWLCKCDCGKETILSISSIRTGKSKSCGCLHDEMVKAGIHTTHGLRHTPEYGAYKTMINRCYNKKQKCFPRYGGKGITVCDQWRNSIAAFIAHMGRRPSPKHTIERINNNGNYEPGNCKWATQTEQANNKKNTIFIEYHGQSHALGVWAKILGINYGTLYSRIFKYRLPIEKCFAHSETIKAY